MRYIFKFPDIGEGLEEGKIIEWYVQKGESISSGDALLKMETDKVVTDIPSPKSGVIAQLFGAVGDTVKVGNALVEIETEVADSVTETVTKTDEVIEEKGFGVVGTIEVAGDGAYLPVGNEGLPSATPVQTAPKKVLATPVARAMAKERGIDINHVQGSGPAGRVTSKDIERFKYDSIPVQSKQVNHDDSSSNPRIELASITQIRKTIAKNMLRSKQNAAHMSVMDEVEVSELVAIRAKLNTRLSDSRLSYLPFIIKAVALSLKRHPVLNAELDLDKELIIYKKYYNIGLAMDTEDGLVVPVIRDADKKSLVTLAKEISILSDKAKSRKLTLDDMKDGTFTITSFGSIGGYFAVPVINYPQSAILGVGRIADKPVIKDNSVVPGKIMPISMSVDHRIVDGGEVARFLNDVLELLREPLLLMAYEGDNNV